MDEKLRLSDFHAAEKYHQIIGNTPSLHVSRAKFVLFDCDTNRRRSFAKHEDITLFEKLFVQYKYLFVIIHALGVVKSSGFK
jgi:hypothetical protein